MFASCLANKKKVSVEFATLIYAEWKHCISFEKFPQKQVLHNMCFFGNFTTVVQQFSLPSN